MPGWEAPGQIGRLQVRALQTDANTITVDAKMSMAEAPTPLTWIADTGSDVDAISLVHLEELGSKREDLRKDSCQVYVANGQELPSLGKIEATLRLHDAALNTTVHVYEGLSDALLSKSSLVALKLLPQDWPSKGQIFQTRALPVDPTPDDIAKIRSDLLHEFSDVFDSTQLKPMTGPPMDIHLHPDATPACAHHARPIPYAFREQVKEQLDDMVTNEIIEPVTEPSEWCHPIVIVNKPGTNEKRFTVDCKKLNRQFQRPAHPMTAPRDAVSDIELSRFFSTLDARHGYWQIPLSEAARPLTTFITPWGRYRYLRNPQGLVSAGDQFNRRMDALFDHIDHFRKVMDDCLVYDDSFPEHVARVRQVLTCARENGVTLSASKFIFAKPEVNYCGFALNRQGRTVDDQKTAAIQQFPVPTNRTDLRSFMGLINQCGEFIPNLAAATAPLCSLLKTSDNFFGRKITPERSMPPRTLSLPRLLCHSFKLDSPSGLRRTHPY